MAEIDDAVSQIHRFDVTRENVRVIGEATFRVEIGIGCEEHYYVFVTSDLLDLQYYDVRSANPHIQRLFAELGIPNVPRLQPVGKSENAIIWPKQLEGRPLLTLIRRPRGSRWWHRLLDLIMPLSEYMPTDEILAYVQGAQRDDSSISPRPHRGDRMR